MSESIAAFHIDIPQADLDDLHERLRRTRWPEPETVDDWSQGIPLAYTRELCRYWLEEYDWQASQARLNRFAQYRTRIDGLDIHFIHVRSPHENALPLLISHGGDAADAFHVICPSPPSSSRRRSSVKSAPPSGRCAEGYQAARRVRSSSIRPAAVLEIGMW